VIENEDTDAMGFSEFFRKIGEVLERELPRVRFCQNCKKAYTLEQSSPLNLELFQKYHEGTLLGLIQVLTFCNDCYTLLISERELERQYIAQSMLHTREYKRVLLHCDRASEAGVPATLTIKEWIKVLDRYKWKCAYCGGSFEVLEHFTPIALGGGTTKENCLPACNFCNALKSSRSPEQIIRSAVGIQRIAQEMKEVQDDIQ
jgi:hypothetical protein